LEELDACDALVVVHENEDPVSPELAFVVGFALARNLPVVWLGTPRNLPGVMRNVQFFATVDELWKQLSTFQDEADSRGLKEAA
jgi:hypothetical protein